MRTITTTNQIGAGDKVLTLRADLDEREIPTTVTLIGPDGLIAIVLPAEQWERIGAAIKRMRECREETKDARGLCVEHGYYSEAGKQYQCPVCHPPVAVKAA